MAAMMAELRSPAGCPWDRQQDHRSLRPYLLEETYEVLEAIDSGVAADLCEELGDLLLQVVFHSELAREKGEFSFWEVVDGITRKIYRRHPHVFRQEKATDARAVSQRWQEIKLREKEQGGKSTHRFDLPPTLPALMKAQKIQKKAAAVGFDWPHVDGALAKVGEELRELEAERAAGNREKIEEEFGDLLFAMVNVARFLGVDAEQSLAAAIRKFTSRFAYIEEKVKASGKDFKAFSLADLDYFWEEAKSRNK
jgi:tetrapyrrole methylase family protein/MazG family protein